MPRRRVPLNQANAPKKLTARLAILAGAGITIITTRVNTVTDVEARKLRIRRCLGLLADGCSSAQAVHEQVEVVDDDQQNQDQDQDQDQDQGQNAKRVRLDNPGTRNPQQSTSAPPGNFTSEHKEEMAQIFADRDWEMPEWLTPSNHQPRTAVSS